jgi:sugar/nucleoside kinase (ribokinase family)
MEFDVYGVGNALVDIQARVADGVLERLGFNKGIMTLVDEAAQLRVLGELEGTDINRCAGGSAANTVIAVADFGGKAAYAGKVSNDALGQFCLRDMRQMGVVIDTPAVPGQTGTSVILITPDAQRTMLTHLGVSATLDPSYIDEDIVRRSKYVYIEGYLFAGESTKAAAYRMLELAKRYRTKVAFTVSDPFLINLFRDEFLRLVENDVDLLFCNLEEARSLSGRFDPIDCAQYLHAHCENVAMTMGAEGSIVMHEKQVLPIEGVSVKAVDTTGAGDMYAGALLYGVTHGMSWKQAGHLASHASARIVEQLGARLHRRFSTDEIRRFMA